MAINWMRYTSWVCLFVGLVGVSLALASNVKAEEPAGGTEAAATDASDSAPAEEEEAEDAPKAFADMTLEEKVDALAASALILDEESGTVSNSVYGDTDTLWTCLAAFLVFFMQAGFTLVEAGFTRAKNACNIVMKNVMDFAIGSLTFWLIGFGLMFGASAATYGFIGTTNFYYSGEGGFDWAFLIFQTVFCATAATIVSGAMAERTKFVGYLCYTVAITVIVYPIFGSWAWGGLKDGGGWLEGGGLLSQWFGNTDLFFNDFAGSTVVHSIGGWCALAGAIVIGPRLGKFGKDGKINAIPGHNIPLAALGVFILWMGWFGFNPGSTTAIGTGSFAKIAVVTNLAAAAGAVAAMITSWIMFKKPDPSFTLNGALAGLVAITAGCNDLSPLTASITGMIGGMLVVFSVLFFDKLRIDDPVGAVSVHGVCGAWGTLAVGLFMPEAGLLMGGGATQFLFQLVGVLAAFAWAFPLSLGIFLAVKYTVGLRVSEAEELEGLDITEHGMHAYPPSMIAEGATGIGGGFTSKPSMIGASSAVVSTSPEGA